MMCANLIAVRLFGIVVKAKLVALNAVVMQCYAEQRAASEFFPYNTRDLDGRREKEQNPQCASFLPKLHLKTTFVYLVLPIYSAKIL